MALLHRVADPVGIAPTLETVYQHARHAQTPVRLPQGSRPQLEVIAPPSKFADTLFRETVGRSKGRKLSSFIAGGAFVALAAGWDMEPLTVRLIVM